MPANWPLWAVLISYLSILFGLAIWSSRSTRDLAGYYLAGRKLPAAVVGFSAASTGESAWLLLGLTGMGYLLGVNALWIVFGEVLATAVAWAFIGPASRPSPTATAPSRSPTGWRSGSGTGGRSSASSGRW